MSQENNKVRPKRGLYNHHRILLEGEKLHNVSSNDEFQLVENNSSKNKERKELHDRMEIYEGELDILIIDTANKMTRQPMMSVIIDPITRQILEVRFK